MITKLRIQNFKSLRDVTLDLQRVNLLIGPNNCGKTNVLKALVFFSEFLGENLPDEKRLQTLCYREGTDSSIYGSAPFRLTLQAKEDGSDDIGVGHIYFFPPLPGVAIAEDISDRGIFAGIARAGITCAELEQDIDLVGVAKLDAQFRSFVSVYWGTSYISLPSGYTEWGGQGKAKDIPNNISSQTRSIITEDSVSGVVLAKEGDAKRYFTPAPTSIQAMQQYPAVQHPVLHPTWDTVGNIWHTLEELVIYRPEPSILLEVYPVRNEEVVLYDASNLVAFLYTLRDRHQDVFERVTKDLRRFVPEFTDISFNLIEVEKDSPIRAKYGEYSYAKVGLRDKHKRTFWAEDLSEGILYFLSLLAIIHQPKPPKILLLEEPEKGMHPRRLREVLDLVFELAEEKDIQVIMTTHSPLVVDYFSDIPKSVFILEKPENETVVKNLQRDVIDPYNKECEDAGEEPIPYTDALGEHWKMGFLGGVPHD